MFSGHFARPHARTMALGLLLALLGSAAGLASPLVTKWVLDSLGEDRSLLGPAGVLLALTLAGSFVFLTQWRLLGAMGERVVLAARTSMVERYLRRDRARAHQAPERRARDPRHVGHRAAERGGLLAPGRDHQQHGDAARDARADGRAGPRPAGHDRRGRGRRHDPVPARDAGDREGQGGRRRSTWASSAGRSRARCARSRRSRPTGPRSGSAPRSWPAPRPRRTSASAPRARRRWRGRSPGPACSWRSS